MRLVQFLTPADKVEIREFCEEMQLKMEEDGFVERLILSDEATFHISGKLNRQSVSREPSNNMHAQIEHQHDSPKVNVF
jgi:fumarylacetoacetate (FAA) hydrolase family protein